MSVVGTSRRSHNICSATVLGGNAPLFSFTRPSLLAATDKTAGHKLANASHSGSIILRGAAEPGIARPALRGTQPDAACGLTLRFHQLSADRYRERFRAAAEYPRVRVRRRRAGEASGRGKSWTGRSRADSCRLTQVPLEVSVDTARGAPGRFRTAVPRAPSPLSAPCGAPTKRGRSADRPRFSATAEDQLLSTAVIGSLAAPNAPTRSPRTSSTASWVVRPRARPMALNVPATSAAPSP